MNQDSKESKDSEEILPFVGKLLHAAGQVEERLEAALADIGLNLSKFAVLDQLMKAGEPLPLTRLAARLACVKSNVTQLIDRLEGDGLVARVDDPDDRRSVLAVIKDEGRRRYKIAHRAVRETEKELEKLFQQDERELLHKFLLRMHKT